MVILGIDPGYAIIGFGLIRPERGQFIPIEYGAILTDADQDFPGRLEVIYRNMTHLMEKWHPDAMAVEKLYFNMLEAKAKWLYTLPEWEDVLPLSKRQEITKAWRKSRQVINDQKIGRNDPCPCGSGKKYKKCCGKDA